MPICVRDNILGAHAKTNHCGIMVVSEKELHQQGRAKCWHPEAAQPNSDVSSAESNASCLSELNDVNEDLNPRNDIVENANNSKDNSMEMEHSANNVILTDMTTNVKSDNIEIDSIGEVVKPIKIVIKGLPIDMDLEEIKTELVNKKFRVEKVTQLKRYKTREPLNIYQIHLFPSDNIKEIYHLTTLSYNTITVEPYENRQHHQCYNFQMWNHGSKNCKLNPKCVICAGKHPSKECPHKGKKEAEIKCANCNGPHTASYRGCPKYPKNIMKNRIQSGKSFAAAASKTVNNPAPPPQTICTESEIFPPLSTNITRPVNSNPPIDNNLGPNQGNLSDIMELATEVSKIFQNVKDIPETLKLIKATDNVWTKFVILAEALR
ncbi:hypothetical protein AVEN_139099-1 [Araneus ventricosus]|uniref:Pre-C2HC domain-containing protein n=1 Tax=Araneus ventricosus TaxID=182803 RepID=A0A4Y2RZ46_ARAVE|nr:hypothetical protein AVEN_139099-1 [Araneus ventricosus]